jgi:eukaryotic-like serine/threonine-protein kinase
MIDLGGHAQIVLGGLTHACHSTATFSYSSPLSPAGSATIDLGRDLGTQGKAILQGDNPCGWHPKAGQSVGPYLLIQPLGAGSQAVVWRATVDADPRREVALKLLATSSSCDHRGEARLRREAGRGMRLHSPAILEVSDFGIADGVAYMAMPLVEGGTLSDVLDWRHQRPARGQSSDDAIWLAPLPEVEYIPALVGIMIRVARALQIAHDAAVIHCDIKPANILLDRRRSEHVFLADFGMGRDLDALESGQRWELSGTPQYMAPELLLGRPADGRLCDMFSLGVTMFESVTGTQPFRPSEDGDPLAGRLSKHALQEPTRVRTLAPWIPSHLAAIIETAMAMNPVRRYPRALALVEELDRFQKSLSASNCLVSSP